MAWEGLWGIGNERKEIESGADARFCRTKGVEFYSKCNRKTNAHRPKLIFILCFKTAPLVLLEAWRSVQKWRQRSR